MRPIIIIGLLCLIGVAQAGLLSSYYISPYGNNANSGLSAAYPFKDLATALSIASRGSTIFAADGVYTGASNAGLIIDGVNLIGSSGDAVFQGDSGTIFELEGPLTISNIKLKGSSPLSDGLELSSGSVTIDSVVFNYFSSAILLEFQAQNVTISNCSFMAHVDQGIYINHSSSSPLEWDVIKVERTAFHNDGWAFYIATSSSSTVWESLSFSSCNFTARSYLILSSLGPKSVTFDSCSFYNVTGSTDGGAMQLSTASPILISDSVFDSCNSADSGGALAVTGTSSASCNLLIRSCLFSNNAANEYGGALVATGSVVVVASTFQGNTAMDDGGAIVQTSGFLTVSQSTFVDNVARSGGAIDTKSSSSSLKLWMVYLQNNTATNGGAIYATSDAVVTGFGVVAVSNKAKEGGGVYIDDSTCNFSSSAFVYGFAESGGALYVHDVSGLNMRQTLILGNNATVEGGGIDCDNGSVNIDMSAFFGNSSPSGSSYSCLGSCTISSTDSYVPSGSTLGCSPLSSVAEKSVEVSMVQLLSMPEWGGDDIRRLYEAHVGAMR